MKCARDRKEYYRKYSDRNKENLLLYRKINKERILALNKIWIARNPERRKEQKKREYRKNIDKYRMQWKLRRARKRGAAGAEYTTHLHIKNRWEMYGNLCWICSRKATATDHVKPISRGGSNWPCNLRPICKLCNSSKGDKWPYPTAARL